MPNALTQPANHFSALSNRACSGQLALQNSQTTFLLVFPNVLAMPVVLCLLLAPSRLARGCISDLISFPFESYQADCYGMKFSSVQLAMSWAAD